MKYKTTMKQSILFFALIFSAFAFSACGGGGGGGSAPAGSSPSTPPAAPAVIDPPVNSDIYGKEITISFNGGRTIVVDFYPDQASDDFSLIVDKVDGKQYRVNWVTLGRYAIQIEGEFLPTGLPIPAAQFQSEWFDLDLDWGGTNDTATFTGTYTPDQVASPGVTEAVSGTVTIVY